MKTLHIETNPQVEDVFDNYPEHIRSKILALRSLIVEAAEKVEEISMLEETLKWGEPSYLTKYGSTIRIDWKSKKPDQYAMYFSCSTRLVDTFKMLFRDTFSFEGKRAIVFQLDDDIPQEELGHCIKAALTYKKVKELPTLGI